MSALEIPGYKIIRTLGVGGQATVYLAIQKGFDREVALKVMSPALAADPSFGERFIREAKIVAKLAHPRIVTVYDVGESGSFYYLSMEYMRGEELKNRIAKGLSHNESLLIIAKLAKALHFAHEKGYIHRDVKSENILFDESDQPILTDFGIAKASNSSTQMTQTGKLIGTPEYMSPEQCRGQKLDGRADLYSLGIILFEMLTKKVPFTGEDSVSICIKHVTQPVPILPKDLSHLQWLISFLLAKSPDDRYQTGEELYQAIEEFVQSGKLTSTKKRSNSKTSISKVVHSSIKRDDFDNESFEINDVHDRDFRINVKPEKKSHIVLMTLSTLMVLSVVTGYILKDRWLMSAQKMIGVNWFQDDQSVGHFNEENINQEKNNGSGAINNKSSGNNKNSTNENEMKKKRSVKNVNEPNAIGDNNTGQNDTVMNDTVMNDRVVNDRVENKKVNNLLKQAKILANYTPHVLVDMRQAVTHLITVKSIAPKNKELILVKNIIVESSLKEALSSADKKLFDNAFQWLILVENIDHENIALEPSRIKVTSLKIASEQEQKNRVEKAGLLIEYIKKAKKALKNGYLSTPVKNNALYFYTKASEISANDSRIKNGLLKIEQRYLDLISKAIDTNEFANASRYIEKLKSNTYFNADLSAIERRYKKQKKSYDIELEEIKRKEQLAEQKKNTERQRKIKLDNPIIQMQLQSNLNIADDLFQQGHLVEPIGNNALEKFNSALKIDALDERAINGIQRIESAIITNIKVALSNELIDIANLWISKLLKFNSRHQKIKPFQNKVIKLQERLMKEKTVKANELVDQEMVNEKIVTGKAIEDKTIEDKTIEDKTVNEKPLQNKATSSDLELEI